MGEPGKELELIRSQPALFQDGEPPLGLDEYQSFTTTTDRTPRPGLEGLGFVLLGLFGEVGSLLSELKKKQRDRDSYVAYHKAVLEEFGDSLWYFANASLRAGLRLSELAHNVPASLVGWQYQGRPSAGTFAQLQRESVKFAGPLSDEAFERRLLKLAGKVGHLLDDFSSGKIDANGHALSADMVEIFRALIAAADAADVSLEKSARLNIVKTLDRWPTVIEWGTFYDADFDQEEQLPRRIKMVFKERSIAGRSYVIQQCNGINLGDRLTDNRVESDDYRFHDVFHLAYAAILGWSPGMRALFRVKRKSRPEVDENQDGARAVLIEEGVSTWVFNHARRIEDFRNVISLDYALLKAVRQLVHGYEVESRPLWQWEKAILEGFRVFRELRKLRGGIVVVDLNDHTIEYQALQDAH